MLKFLCALVAVVFALTMAQEYDPRSFLANLPSTEDVQERINDRYDSMFNMDDNDNLIPFVCCVCDEFMLPKRDVNVVSIAKMKKAKDILSCNLAKK